MLIPYLDFILLFIFTFAYTRAFDFFRTSTFDIRLYPIYFILIFIYLIISLEMTFKKNKGHNNLYLKAKLIIFSLIFLITVVKTFYSAINLRHDLGLNYPVHDNPLQIEAGVNYLKQGKNPYTENYFGTKQEQWYEHNINMALYHFVTLPFYIIFSLLISIPSEAILGYFDERMVHGLALAIVIGLIYKLISPITKKIIFLTLFIFNPYFIHFFIEGRNDIFVFTGIFLSLYLLFKNKYQWSALALGLACASKQSSWLILPLYFYYIWVQLKLKFSFQSIAKLWQKTWPFFICSAIFFTPFLAWDSQSFIEDIYLFPGGGLPTSYPISGMGVSQLMLQLGLIKNPGDNYPFIYLQLIAGLPVLVFLGYKLSKHIRVSYLAFAYGIFLGIFWLFSRFFADNYAGYLSMVFIMGMVFKETEDRLEFTGKNKLIAE